MEIILYSHGFGVDKTDRGLFSGVATHLPRYRHVMFDYNMRNERGQMVVAALDKQAGMLKEVYEKTKSENPDANIDLICHSQGCVVAALAKLPVGNTLFLAPPLSVADPNNKLKLRTYVFGRTGTKTLADGSTEWPRSDGSTTIISRAYWDSYDALSDVNDSYGVLAGVTDLTMFVVTDDEILGHSDCSELPSGIKVILMETGHNFANVRREVAEKIEEILK